MDHTVLPAITPMPPSSIFSLMFM